MRFPKNTRLPHDRYNDGDLAFHIVIRTHPEIGTLAPTQMSALWELVLAESERDAIQLYAACLMPDHVHFLISALTKDVIRFVDDWKSWTTRRSWRWGNRGALWQPGFNDRAVRNQADFNTVYLYVTNNPVDAGLSESPSGWPFTYPPT